MRYKTLNFFMPLTALLIFILGIATQIFLLPSGKNDIPALELILCSAVIFIPVAVLGAKRISQKQIIIILFIIGCILRICYSLSTESVVRQHDVFDNNGHFDYIMTVMNDFKLPQTNSWQFYHPPLHYILSALFLKPFSLMGITDKYMLGNFLQMLTALYSCLAMFFVYKILEIIGIKSKALSFTFSIICFHPTLILLSGSLNNDCLSILLIIISVFFSLKQYISPNIKNTVFLALSFGLAMATKISSIVILPAVILLFLIKLYKNFRQQKVLKNNIIQIVLFFVISLPLSVAYPLRNFLKFNQPFLYVAKISETSDLYCGNYSLWERFGLPINIPDNSGIFCNPFKDFNLILYTTKCSVFGEWSYDVSKIISCSLLIFNLLLIVISLVFMTFCIINYKKYSYIKPEFKIFFFFIWVLQIVSFVFANIKYPFGCTMDFRYIVPTIVTGTVFIGIITQKLIAHHYPKSILFIVKTVGILFCISSFTFFLSI